VVGKVKPAVSHIVDQTVGAASTLVVELLDFADLLGRIAPELAALLALGIHSDTKELLGAGPRDRAAIDRLQGLEWFDGSLLDGLIRYDLPESFFRNSSRAYSDLEKSEDGMLLSCAGRLDPRDWSDLALIADRLIRMTGTTTAVVWAVINDQSCELVCATAIHPCRLPRESMSGFGLVMAGPNRLQVALMRAVRFSSWTWDGWPVAPTTTICSWP